MLLIINFITTLLTIIPLISLFKPKSITKYFIASFVLFCSIIIVIGNFLGLISKLNNIIAWLTCHIFLLIVSWLLWFLFKKPKLFPAVNLHTFIKEFSIFEKIVLSILLIAIFVCYLVLIYLIIIVPPNNNDSMVVHLVRVGYWIQQGSFKPWDALIERQIIYPYNAQIILVWLTLFLRIDILTPLLQFFCALFTAVSIYGISRILGANKFISLFLGSIYLTFPQVILQSTTTQNDMVVTFFIAAGTFFLFDWFKNKFHSNSSLILCGISYAISLGIKATSYYFFVGLIISLLILLLIKKLSLKHIVMLGGSIIIAFVPLSSLAYINNYITFGTPVGPENFLKSESGVVDQGNLLEKIKINSFRFLYQMSSLDGYPFSIQRKFIEIKKNFAEKHPNLFDTSPKYIKDLDGEVFSLDPYIANNEDLSWFGPIFPLLAIPGVCLGVIRSFHKKNSYLIVLITSGIISFLSVTVLRPGWDPYQGRYMNTAVAIIFPVVSILFDRKIITKSVVSILLPFILIPLINTTFINDSKPLITQSIISANCNENFFNYFQCCLDRALPEKIKDNDLPTKASITRLDSRVARRTYTNNSQLQIFEYIEMLPKGSRIAILLSNGDWEYPFFGDNFQFVVFPISLPEKITQQDLDQMDADFIVVHNRFFDNNVIEQSYKIIQKIVGDDTTQNWIVFGK